MWMLIGIVDWATDCWGQGSGHYQKIVYLRSETERILQSGIPSICPLQPGENPFITSYFGMRYHPLDGKYKMHNGIDLACPRGFQFVYATACGIILHAGSRQGLGLSISILHFSEYESGYGHLSALYVKKGDWVEAGDVIGVMGQTGRATGVHLHYSLRKDGKWVDPLPYLTLYKSIENKKDAGAKASEH